MPFDPCSTPLSPVQARVLATLLEKSRTVPDSYPLTLNSLVLGCNQKSSRDPVMQLDEASVQAALDDLRLLSLVVEVGGARVTRWEHNLPRVLAVPDQSAALLGLLMLRGPQTAGELRIHSERWHRFADISSVEAFLEELAERSPEKGGPLVALQERAAGAREPRWVHLLCGPQAAMAPTPEPYAQPSAATPATALSAGDSALVMAQRLQALEVQVADLQAQVEQLRQVLGGGTAFALGEGAE